VSEDTYGDTAMLEIEKQQLAAMNTRDLDRYRLYAAMERELKHLRAVGRLAARIYEDHSDEEAWEQLFDVLSDAGLL
jgi:hypothetical protein